MKATMYRLAGVAALAGLAACGGEREPVAATVAAVDVQVVTATVADVPHSFEAGGTVRARTTATLVSRIVAEVRDVRVAPGDRVRRGQPLVLLDDREPSANRTRAETGATAAEQTARAADASLEAAEASRALARATHERIAGLHAKNSATPHELDEALAGLRAAEAQVAAARARVAESREVVRSMQAAAEAARVAASYAALTAPFDGVVTEKLTDPGNLAAPGVPLLTVEDTRGFRLEVRLDESRAALVAVGEPAEVSVGGSLEPDAGERVAALTGRIAEIARALDPGSHAFLIKVDLPDDGRLRSGMFGRARFAGPGRRALTVPAASLVRRGQLVSVFVVDAEGVARLRLVNVAVAVAAGDRVEVLAGLEPGETVVVGPPPALADGTPVSPRRAPGGNGDPR